MFRILLYALIFYLVYQLVLRPLFQGFNTPSDKPRPKANGPKKDRPTPEGEYIDYEEIKE